MNIDDPYIRQAMREVAAFLGEPDPFPPTPTVPLFVRNGLALICRHGIEFSEAEIAVISMNLPYNLRGLQTCGHDLQADIQASIDARGNARVQRLAAEAQIYWGAP